MSNFVSKIKYIFILAMCFVAFLAIDANADTVKLNDSQKTVLTGTKFKLGYTSDVEKLEIVSSDKTIVAVKKVNAKKVVLKAKKAGVAKIKFKYGKKTKKCKIRVNDTFCINDSDVVISKPTKLTVHYTGKGYVRNIKPSYCEVTYADHWDGDDMVVTITPIYKGSESIKFFNTENDEIFYVDIKNTDTVKRNEVTRFTYEADNSAEVFIAGENKLKIGYSVLNDISDAVLYVKARKTGELVYSEKLKNLKGGTVYYSTWDGYIDGKIAEQGAYYLELVGQDLYGTPEHDVALFNESPFGKGDGSATNPYVVSSVNDLLLLSAYPNASFIQGCDIVIGMDNEKSDYELVRSIFDSTPFEGTYDGAGHKISDFYTYHSVFGILGEKAEVKNLTIENGTVVNSENFFADENAGRIEKITINKCNLGVQQNATNIAFMVGYNSGVITNCDIQGTIVLKKTIGDTILEQEKTLVAGLVIDNSGRIAYTKSDIVINAEVALTTIKEKTAYEIVYGAIAAVNQQSGMIADCKYGTDINVRYRLPRGYAPTDLSVIEGEPVQIEGQLLKIVDNVKITTDTECGEIKGLKSISIIDCTPLPKPVTDTNILGE